jgi:hypothetical protein
VVVGGSLRGGCCGFSAYSLCWSRSMFFLIVGSLLPCRKTLGCLEVVLVCGYDGDLFSGGGWLGVGLGPL